MALLLHQLLCSTPSTVMTSKATIEGPHYTLMQFVSAKLLAMLRLPCFSFRRTMFYWTYPWLSWLSRFNWWVFGWQSLPNFHVTAPASGHLVPLVPFIRFWNTFSITWRQWVLMTKWWQTSIIKKQGKRRCSINCRDNHALTPCGLGDGNTIVTAVVLSNELKIILFGCKIS